MNLDELLREAAPSLHESRIHASQLRADVLQRAPQSAPRRTRRRKVLPLAAALLVGATAVGGVAYATGGVPPLVSSEVTHFAHNLHVTPADQPQMSQIVNLELPDGSRFAAWSGVSQAMSCFAYTDNWDGKNLDNGASSCSDGGERTLNLNRVHIVWAENEAGTTYYPVAFGLAVEGAASVHITGTFSGTGEPVDLLTPVDPTTGAFATVLPGVNDHPWPHSYLDPDPSLFRASNVAFSFIGDDGQVLRSIDGPHV